ncbi:MAG: PAS domain S-box protein [Theionarchaea archaeon]|nr:PAS domain S-box protein [Theionarchaea archaeon]
MNPEKNNSRNPPTPQINHPEEALVQSELHYRTLFESMPIAVGISTLDGRVLECNEAMVEMSGYSREEFEQINLESTYENPEERTRLLNQLQETGVIRDFEVHLKRKDGSLYCASLTMVLDVLNGRPILLTMARDITEQNLAKEKLRESEEKYRDLVENIHDVIYAVDGKGVITYVSPSVESFLGFNPSELAGRHFREFAYEEDLPRIRENFQKTLSGHSVANEYRLTTKSHHIRWVHTSSRPVYTGDQVIGVQGVMVDITDRKRIEEELQRKLDIEGVLTAISTHLIYSRPEEINQEIHLALKKIGEFTDADRCNVFLLEENGTKMRKVHEWCLHSIESSKDQLQSVDANPFEWGINQLEKLNVLNISRVLDLLEEPVKRLLQSRGIQSILCVPLFIGGVFFGFIGLESVRKEREWSDNTVSMLKVAAEVFANALERKRSEEALRESEEQYHTTIDSIGEAIHVVDTNLRIMLFNKAFEEWNRVLGLPTEVVGKTLFEVFPFLPDKVKEELDQVFTTGKMLITTESTKIGDAEFITETRKIPITEEGKVTRVITVIQDITERKKAEEELRESEEKFRTLFENQGVGIALIKLDMPPREKAFILESNSALQKFLGYTEDELRLRVVTEFSHPEELERDIGRLEELIAGKTNSLEVEKRFIRKDGEIVWGYLTVSLLRDAHGIPVYVVVSVQDTTEHKKAEEALRKSEEEFRLFFENAKDAIFWAEPETGTIIRCNKAAEILLEKNREEIIGYHQTELHPPDKRGYYAEIFKTHVDMKGSKDVEGEVITKSGIIKPVHITASITLIGGSPIIQGIFRDVTESKRAERELQESEEKYRTLVEQSLQGIAIAHGIPLRLVFMNTALSEMLGYTTEELLSLNSQETLNLVHPEDQSFFSEQYQDILEGNPSLPLYELRLIRKDGTICWLEIHANRIEYCGQPAIQAAFMDITDRKKAEEQIKASLKEKEILLREIHHRVKNNLQVVSSLLNLQSEHIRDSQYTEMLKESQNRIRTMALIHEKLYQSENLANIDISEYITSVVHGLIRSYNVDERIILSIDVEGIPLSVDAAIPCGLIINELVSNCLKHAFPHKRKGVVTITLCQIQGTNELVVKDDGVGIPDTIDLKNMETLGLDLVTTLAEKQLNGTITLDKTGGTTFTIRFREVL